MPKTPVRAAGTLIDPAPSEAIATEPIPEAMLPAAPSELTPVVLSGL